MTLRIYAMPPVAYTASTRDWEMPVAVSVNARTGDEVRTGFGAQRRLVSVVFEPLANRRDGAGYLDNLRRKLGGVHAVRLRMPPLNWHRDHVAEQGPGGLHAAPMGWTAGGQALGWTAGGAPLLWFVNSPHAGVAAELDGHPAISVNGLPPDRLVCRAGDTLRSYTGGGASSQAEALRTVFSGAGGVAVVPLMEPLPAGWISFSDEREIVARAVGIGPSVQPTAARWPITWSFREMRQSEILGAEEVNPWITG